MTSIGRKIRDARKNASMTQVELAKATNLSRSYIGDIEKDRYNPSVSTLQAIAKATNVPVENLLGGNAPAPPAPQKSIEASPAQKEDREHKHLQNLLSDPHLRRILESSGQLSESSLQEVQNFIDFQLGKKKQ